MWTSTLGAAFGSESGNRGNWREIQAWNFLRRTGDAASRKGKRAERQATDFDAVVVPPAKLATARFQVIDRGKPAT
ncbi:hypothetical protein ASG57_33770 [Bradyrhizobium sp. Leaf396]|nr:hypothetical protein ASG57_33770 [Bradyrhizobium sp. Leaf396]